MHACNNLLHLRADSQIRSSARLRMDREHLDDILYRPTCNAIRHDIAVRHGHFSHGRIFDDNDACITVALGYLSCAP
jgi:hypothetical protein